MNKISLTLEDSPILLDNHGPIFIIGCPRSGTTFLSTCLAAIDEIESFVGVIVPPRMIHLLNLLDNTHQKEILMLSIRDVFWQSFWRRCFFRSERITQILNRNKPLFSLLDKGSIENKRFCYKEPFLCFGVEDFAKQFPTARFLHIYRDGRDTADSLIRTYPNALSDEVLSSEYLASNKISEIGHWRKVSNFLVPYWVQKKEETSFIKADRYGRYLYLWKEMTHRAISLKTTIPNRYYEVKYEDFVQSPLEEANKIANFIGTKLSDTTRKRLTKAFSESIGISKRRQSIRKYTLADDLLSHLGYDL